VITRAGAGGPGGNGVAGHPEPSLDVDALARWLDTQDLPGAGEPVDHQVISGGSQNEIFEIRRGDLHAALRKPPAPAPRPRDEGILREWRILVALEGTEVAHAAAIAVCPTPDVLGRPFYLMGVVDGWSPMSGPGWVDPFDHDLDARQGLAVALVDGAAQMSTVDWIGRGLGDLGHPEGFHDRQVERWTTFYRRIAGRELPGLDEATRWLAERRPLDFAPGLMHGDYQFANVMYRHGAPAELAAIIDWEMGTIGDPKLDLAWALHGWPDDDSGTFHLHYADLTGMPHRSELLEQYATRSGRQVDDIDYYLVLARWKLAIVLEQGYQRANGDPRLESFGSTVLALMARAAELAARSRYR
jgi:aminoglycoside phosphotransferase (APT) family kinase protein